MVLLDLLLACDIRPAVAHCNFKLRGAESDKDAAFVRIICDEHSLQYREAEFDTANYASTHRGSVQMAARKLRYEWFRELMESESYELLLTAHHLDDNLETFLINLSRGSGLKGLSGIPASTHEIIRPLLPFSREQIQSYALEKGLKWREDASNADQKYLRNKIRHSIIPELKQIHPAYEQNFTRSLHHLSGSAKMLEHYRELLVEKLFQRHGDTYKILISELQKMAPLKDYLYLLFQPFGFSHPGSIKKLMDASNSKAINSDTHRLLKDREHLIISPQFPGNSLEHTEDLGSQGISIEEVAALEEVSGRDVIYVDKEKLNGPLFLRKWQKGDYFYPFGMGGKQKLSKFFKDQKYDPIQKEQQWLLCSGESIVWVIGRRADDRFRVDDTTKEILKIQCQENHSPA